MCRCPWAGPVATGRACGIRRARTGQRGPCSLLAAKLMRERPAPPADVARLHGRLGRVKATEGPETGLSRSGGGIRGTVPCELTADPDVKRGIDEPYRLDAAEHDEGFRAESARAGDPDADDVEQRDRRVDRGGQDPARRGADVAAPGEPLGGVGGVLPAQVDEGTGLEDQRC